MISLEGKCRKCKYASCCFVGTIDKWNKMENWEKSKYMLVSFIFESSEEEDFRANCEEVE